MTLLHDHHQVVYDADSNYPFRITAKRYLPVTANLHSHDADAVTLILLHSTSFHKEIWEPTLEHLFYSKGLKVREAWAIDCPNHGASAALNETALRTSEHFDRFGCEDYARACHRFLTAGPRKGAKVDFASRRLLGVGHSLGGVAMTILQEIRPIVHFETVILIEPMLSPHGQIHLVPLGRQLIKGAYERRDIWPNRKIAYENLKSRDSTKRWDPRILALFVEFGLREHPGARYSPMPYDGVALCCTREQEAAMYRDLDGCITPVSDLNNVCKRMPTHIILGTIHDYIPPEVHDAITDIRSRQFASITRLQGVGHLVPQEAPKALASVIQKILKDHQDRAWTMPPARL